MNKKIRRIIAFTLTISTISAVEPSKYVNLFTTEAHAASQFNLRNIFLSDGEIEFSPDVRSYDVKVAGSVDEIRITAKPDCTSSYYDDYKVDIDGTIVDKEDNFRTALKLFKGKNEIKVRIENKDGKKKTYTLNITRGRSDSDAPYGKDVYLDDIYLDYGDVDINFDKNKTSYNIKVKSNMEQIAIRAIPKDSGSKVRINGSLVKEDRDDKEKGYKKMVDLKKGKNEVEIEVKDEDDENERIYKLNITRGKSSIDNEEEEKNTTTSNQRTEEANTIKTNVKSNQWVQVNGEWNYNDASGTTLKNTWFNDKSTGKNYYLQANGAMARGWLNNNLHWYYFDVSGVMQTGWKYIDGNWYYINADGMMQTGWFKNGNGNWYYLQASGAMAKNTTISGYKLGSDGAWIK